MIAEEIARFAVRRSRSSTSSTGQRCGVIELEPLLLAIDAGTGSCRAVLFDTDGAPGRDSASASTRTPTLPGVPGSQVFDTERNWG